jgi:hypothetical protein
MLNQKMKRLPFILLTLLVLAACDAGTTSVSITTSNSSQTAIQHTVTFRNYDDSVLLTQTVNQGFVAIYSGPTPIRPGTTQHSYTFSGWDQNLTNVTSSFSTTAQYSQASTPSQLDG